MLQLATFSITFLSCLLLLRSSRLASPAEYLIYFFLFFSAEIIISGNLLSSYNVLDDVKYWLLAGISFFIFSLIILLITHGKSAFIISRPNNLIHNVVATQWSNFEKMLIIPMGITVLLIICINFTVIVLTPPHHWDGMTYHLPRMLYYLKQHNLNYFDANYWAQVVHPKNSTILVLYSYLVSGKNENATQLVQFIAYIVSIASVYAISLQLSTKKQALFAALTSGLLIEWILQSTTLQNDLLITAFFGITIYSLLAFRKTGKHIYLALSVTGASIALGIKASVLLPLLSAGIIALFCLYDKKISIKKTAINTSIFMSFGIIALLIFTMPAGYLDNYRQFGHPVGPASVRTMHSFEGMPIEGVVKNGSKNMLRYSMEFLSADGIPRIGIVNSTQNFARNIPAKLISMAGINLESPEATRVAFTIIKNPAIHPDFSYWGVLGFALIWPMVLISAFGRKQGIAFRIFSIASIIFLITQAYAGPYDPWRGRYFAIAAILAVPVAAQVLNIKHRLFQIYLLVVILTACTAALSATILRNDGPLISYDHNGKHTKSIFIMDRMELLTINKPESYPTLKKFEDNVPQDSIVAIYLSEDSLEYPLFGEKLDRTLIPVKPFAKPSIAIPLNAEYLLYQSGFPCASENDIHLGENWFLRKLDNGNRKCF